MSERTGYRPNPRYLELGDTFYDVVEPAQFPLHRLRFRNQRWAERVGLAHLDDERWLAHFSRFEPLPDNLREPVAMRYHGHQFDVYNPDLGDGRGFLYAQLTDDRGRLLDLGTKGSGQTPYSRGGDGRLTLKGGVREILATEMLEARGVSTSKTFSVVETGERLSRGDEPSPTRSCVLVRLSHSHIRFGTFQRLAFHDDRKGLARLVEYVVEHLYPELSNTNDVPRALVRKVTERCAETCARWMAGGFVHGVLNSDNMNVTGESFDYGPYRFLPVYDPGFVAAYFDHTALYAYGNQPRAVLTNLSRLNSALSRLNSVGGGSAGAPPVTSAELTAIFSQALDVALQRALIARLGLASRGPDEDSSLVDAALSFLAATQMPFDQFFFDWFGGMADEARAKRSPARTYYEGDDFSALGKRLAEYDVTCPAALATPYFGGDGPVTLLIEEIEALWERIARQDNWEPFEAKVRAIRSAGAECVGTECVGNDAAGARQR